MFSHDQEQALYRIVGRRVRRLRKPRLTQEELGDLAGLSRASIANLEAGRQRLPLHHLVVIADALEVDLSALVPNSTELGLLGQPVGDIKIVADGDLSPGVRAVVAKVMHTPRVENNEES